MCSFLSTKTHLCKDSSRRCSSGTPLSNVSVLRLPDGVLPTSLRGVAQVCAQHCFVCFQGPVAEALWSPRQKRVQDHPCEGQGVVSHTWPAQQQPPGKLLTRPVPSTLVMIPTADCSELRKEQSKDLLLQMNHLNSLQDLKTPLRQSSKKQSSFLQNLQIFSPSRFATKSHNKKQTPKNPQAN